MLIGVSSPSHRHLIRLRDRLTRCIRQVRRLRGLTARDRSAAEADRRPGGGRRRSADRGLADAAAARGRQLAVRQSTHRAPNPAIPPSARAASPATERGDGRRRGRRDGDADIGELGFTGAPGRSAPAGPAPAARPGRPARRAADARRRRRTSAPPDDQYGDTCARLAKRSISARAAHAARRSARRIRVDLPRVDRLPARAHGARARPQADPRAEALCSPGFAPGCSSRSSPCSSSRPRPRCSCCARCCSRGSATRSKSELAAERRAACPRCATAASPAAASLREPRAAVRRPISHQTRRPPTGRWSPSSTASTAPRRGRRPRRRAARRRDRRASRR